jgi:hypothetical protein
MKILILQEWEYNRVCENAGYAVLAGFGQWAELETEAAHDTEDD